MPLVLAIGKDPPGRVTTDRVLGRGSVASKTGGYGCGRLKGQSTGSWSERSFAHLECSLSDKLGAGRLKFRDRSRCRQAFDNVTAGSYKLFGLSIKHHQTVELCEVRRLSPFLKIVLALRFRRPECLHGNIATSGRGSFAFLNGQQVVHNAFPRDRLLLRTWSIGIHVVDTVAARPGIPGRPERAQIVSSMTLPIATRTHTPGTAMGRSKKRRHH